MYQRGNQTGKTIWIIVAALLCLMVVQTAGAERIKDLAVIAGVRSNYLVGYGLIVGLDRSGDQTIQTPFTVQSVLSMLRKFGVTIPPGVIPQLTNVAAVALHAELPPFAKPGQTIDVTVSSIGNAKSLRGGSLLAAPLYGVNGEVYALAQGNLVVGGLGIEGADGSSITINVPSVGRIPNGAIIERPSPTQFGAVDAIVLNLHTPDFTTAKRLSEIVNESLNIDVAKPVDAASVFIRAPEDAGQRVSFMSLIENLTVEPGEAAAKIIVNSRTGTIVIGSHVRVSPAAVTHGSLTVTITEDFSVSQPGPLSPGQTQVIADTGITVDQGDGSAFLFAPGTSLEAIVRAINEVGAAPGDLVAILEALKQAGALRAELIII
ncbi:MAG: flagellar basal body P-ring protein FlgI [Gammaproteobacteria bacterium]|nr:flagellar basal body P-ring protein FlgI [Gammaproteobacteria bacterium]